MTPQPSPSARGFETTSLVRVLTIERRRLRLDTSEVEAAASRRRSSPEDTAPDTRATGPDQEAGRVVLAIDGSAVEYLGEGVALGALGLRLLSALAAKPARVIAHAEIAHAVWDEAGTQYIEQIRGHAKAVNDALRSVQARAGTAGLGGASGLLKPKRGLGYYLDLDPRSVALRGPKEPQPGGPR